MEQTKQAFKESQAGTLKALRELQCFLDRGVPFGLEPDWGIRAKLDAAVRAAENDKLRVALVGGFSEGKTAIAAAWLEHLDKSTMTISHQESSNAVTVYEAGPDCVLIDTPGLFGFKEEFNENTNSGEKYKEMTRKFVSEAHLVLYVMDPANPIKESHREELIWLFRTLGLLTRTVFVLSRFDAVADVEDERDYQQALAVKKKSIEGRLCDLIALSDAEAADLAVVAVAADPFEMGMEHWLSNLERFRALSRINSLQRAASEKVSSAGGAAAVIEDARRSIVRDVLGRQLPLAVRNDEAIAHEVQQLEMTGAELKRELDKAVDDMTRTRQSLQAFVLDYFTDLIVQVKGLSSRTFAEFFERNIGADGIVLNARLQHTFEAHVRSVKLELEKLSIGIDAEVDHFNDSVRAYGKQGVDYVLKGGLVNRTSVLAARDGIVSAAKVVGIDVSKALKFKPWGAVNLAKGLEGALAALGLALELWDSWEQANRERAFREGISKMVENFEKQRSELHELVCGAEFEAQFFPEMMDLRRKVDEVLRCVAAAHNRREEFRNWRKQGETIDAQFRELVAVRQDA
jgi:GTP-binding protein EngB required for normal cell division